MLIFAEIFSEFSSIFFVKINFWMIEKTTIFSQGKTKFSQFIALFRWRDKCPTVTEVVIAILYLITFFNLRSPNKLEMGLASWFHWISSHFDTGCVGSQNYLVFSKCFIQMDTLRITVPWVAKQNLLREFHDDMSTTVVPWHFSFDEASLVFPSPGQCVPDRRIPTLDCIDAVNNHNSHSLT